MKNQFSFANLAQNIRERRKKPKELTIQEILNFSSVYSLLTLGRKERYEEEEWNERFKIEEYLWAFTSASNSREYTVAVTGSEQWWGTTPSIRGKCLSSLICVYVLVCINSIPLFSWLYFFRHFMTTAKTISKVILIHLKYFLTFHACSCAATATVSFNLCDKKIFYSLKIGNWLESNIISALNSLKISYFLSAHYEIKFKCKCKNFEISSHFRFFSCWFSAFSELDRVTIEIERNISEISESQEKFIIVVIRSFDIPILMGRKVNFPIDNQNIFSNYFRTRRICIINCNMSQQTFSHHTSTKLGTFEKIIEGEDIWVDTGGFKGILQTLSCNKSMMRNNLLRQIFYYCFLPCSCTHVFHLLLHHQTIIKFRYQNASIYKTTDTRYEIFHITRLIISLLEFVSLVSADFFFSSFVNFVEFNLVNSHRRRKDGVKMCNKIFYFTMMWQPTTVHAEMLPFCEYVDSMLLLLPTTSFSHSLRKYWQEIVT